MPLGSARPLWWVPGLPTLRRRRATAGAGRGVSRIRDRNPKEQRSTQHAIKFTHASVTRPFGPYSDSGWDETVRSSLAGGSALVVVDVTPLVDSETEVPVAEDAVVDDESEDAEDADVADDMTAWSSRSAPFSWTGHRMG